MAITASCRNDAPAIKNKAIPCNYAGHSLGHANAFLLIDQYGLGAGVLAIEILPKTPSVWSANPAV